MLSIQTNINSLVAQQNLNINNTFQSNTIQQLTSGYRINSASDDAAGLAVANKFRDDIAELTQGVRNANDGVAQLQIADGGLSNISNILDRLKTLATESASNTFTGNRATLNNEYQSLLSEVDRQAANIGLNAGGSMNKQLQVYLGGGSTQSNAQVTVNLGGAANQTDSAGLGIKSTGIAAGGVTLASNTVTTLNNPGQMVLTGGTTGDTATFSINYVNGSNAAATATVTVTSNDTNGITVANALNQMNAQLGQYGLSAAVNAGGSLVIGGTAAFAVASVATNANGGGAVTNYLATDISAGTDQDVNNGIYNVNTGTITAITGGNTETLSFSNGTISKQVIFNAGNTGSSEAIANAINTAVGSLGIYALATDSVSTGTAGHKLSIQSSGAFTVTMVTPSTDTDGPFGTLTAGQTATINGPSQTASVTGNALSALTAIENAVSELGQVQGKVGAGENQLNYAINLAQSQITNFSSAESQIRDADVAAEAANLSKSQVLQQASIAAMAQANSAPQAVLSLLKG